MQLLFLADLGSDALLLIEDFAKVPPVDFGSSGIMMTGVAFVIAVFACWLASQLVKKENTGLGRAIKTAILYGCCAFAIGLLAGGGIWFAALQGSETMLKVSALIGGVLALYAAVSIPMGVYKINAVKALGFVIVALIVQAAAHVAAMRMMKDPLRVQALSPLVRRLAALPVAERAESLRKLRASATPVVVAPTPKPEKSIGERHTALKKTYADLQARRLNLREGDQTGIDAYTRDTAAYTELLTQLQKDNAAEEARGK